MFTMSRRYTALLTGGVGAMSTITDDDYGVVFKTA